MTIPRLGARSLVGIRRTLHAEAVRAQSLLAVLLVLTAATPGMAQHVPGAGGNGGVPGMPGSNGLIPDPLAPPQPTLPTTDPTRIQVPVPDAGSPPATNVNAGGREGGGPGLE
jgi:hypothetical protein